MLEFGLRIGEILVRQGLIDTAHLDRGLSAQVVHGGRIGTNLVELGAVAIDELAAALGQQHGVPVADRTMLGGVTRETLSIVPATLCARYGVLPLRYESPSQLHLAMLDPHKLDLLDELGGILGVATIHSYVVPELRLHYYLELHHEIPRPKRFLRSPVPQEPPPVPEERRSYLEPSFTQEELPPLDVDLDGPGEPRTTGDFEVVISLDGFEEEPAPAPEPTEPPPAAPDDEPADDDDILAGFDDAFGDELSAEPPPAAPAPKPTTPPAEPADDDDILDGFDDAFEDNEAAEPPGPPPPPKAAPPAAEPPSSDDIFAGFDEAFADKSSPEPPPPAPPAPKPPKPPRPPESPRPSGGEYDAILDGFDEAFDEVSLPEPPELRDLSPDGPSDQGIPVLEDAVDRLEQAADREELIDLLLQPLVPESDVSLLFVLRDEMAVALGARGTDLSRREVSTLVVPISMSAQLQRALQHRSVARIDARGDPMQQIIANFLGRQLPGEACLVPITFEGQVVNVLCIQTGGKFSEESLETLALVSVTASHTYRRIKPRADRPTARSLTVEVPPKAEPGSASGSVSISTSSSMVLEDSSSQIPDPEPPPPEEDGSRPAHALKLIPAKQRRFGRYTLICRLASGGMANLYLAQLAGKEGFEKLVAIKRIHEHLSEKQQFIKMFIDEARLAARISHPNVAQVIELDQFENSHFIAMEYVDGEGLHALLRAARPKMPLIARIIAHAAAGLHAAHELQDQRGNSMGVVHRDVSPQNILISYQGAVKVVDFGVARARGNLAETVMGTVKGKVSYMSPEQVQSGPVDRRSDVFGLGVVLYEATTFRRLFKADNEIATMRKVVEGEITPPTRVREDYPPELEQIVMKALQRDRTRRYQSAEELQAALEMYIMGSGSLVLASALGKLMKQTFRHNIKEKQRVLAEFEAETG